MKVCAIILAAGKGTRFGGDKITELLGGKPLWRWSYDTFRNHPLVDSVGLLCAESQREKLALQAPDAAFVLTGGDNRQESSRIGVEAADADIVLIHDAARPFISDEVIDRVIEATMHEGAAAPAVPVTDTLRQTTEYGSEFIDRSRTIGMQTPQAARRELLLRAHREGTRLETDEMALLQSIGQPFAIVDGDSENFKVTTAADLRRARQRAGGPEVRTGIGYDIHRFSLDPERKLVLGGVLFKGETGLEGHSDADVVIHAVVDALLGAAALGDIGQHFPNTDPRWKGEPSTTFLHHAANEICSRGWSILNVDITLIGERPRVMLREGEIRTVLSEMLKIDCGRIGFKATTNESLGAIGRGEGLAAFAIATIREREV